MYNLKEYDTWMNDLAISGLSLIWDSCSLAQLELDVLKWEPLELPNPSSVVTIKQYKIPGRWRKLSSN